MPIVNSKNNERLSLNDNLLTIVDTNIDIVSINLNNFNKQDIQNMIEGLQQHHNGRVNE